MTPMPLVLQVPRAKQLAMLREKASEGEGLDGMAWLLGYNDPTDTASKGVPDTDIKDTLVI